MNSFLARFPKVRTMYCAGWASPKFHVEKLNQFYIDLLVMLNIENLSWIYIVTKDGT